jgi:hypothetical protein
MGSRALAFFTRLLSLSFLCKASPARRLSSCSLFRLRCACVQSLEGGAEVSIVAPAGRRLLVARVVVDFVHSVALYISNPKCRLFE